MSESQKSAAGDAERDLNAAGQPGGFWRTPWRERPRWLRMGIAVTGLAASAALVLAPWWAPAMLSKLDFFHVRTIVFEGVTFAKPAELIAELQVDTTQSVWQSLDSLEVRLSDHPMVASVVVERDLPGTIRVIVTEREPVALVASRQGFRATDATGAILPIDPSVHPLDVPLVNKSDSALLAVLDALRRNAPELYTRVSEAERVAPQELRFTLSGSKIGAAGPSMTHSVIVRSMPDVTVARFRDILRVEANLAQNHLRAVELDLRFRLQVIARQP